MDSSSIFQEFGFDVLGHLSDQDLVMMNRPLDFQEDTDEDELEKYGLKTVSYKDQGMGNYSIIGKRMIGDNNHSQECIYFFLLLGGSSGWESLDNHIIAQHYVHHNECGQTLEELTDFLRDEEKKEEPFDKCRGFPLIRKITWVDPDYKKIKKFYDDPENKDRCYLCHR